MEVIAENLEKIYPNGTKAIENVSFTAKPGFTILMGPNGSGKTTTLNIIAGALKPTRGRVLIGGYDLWGPGWYEARELIGFAPQDMPFREKLSATENLVWYGLIRGLGLRESRKRALALLREVGLEDHGSKMVSQLSGGMRRRLSIAAALMGDPSVVILDEPTSGLDPSARRELWQLLRRLSGDRVVIASTHIARDAEENADVVLIFHGGRIVARGSPRDLIEKYAPESVIHIYGSIPKPVTIEGAKTTRYTMKEMSIVTRDPEDILPRIVEALLASGAVLEKIELRKPGLDEVYLVLTGARLEG